MKNELAFEYSVEVACEKYGVTRDQLLEKGRYQPQTEARMFAMYLMRNDGLSLNTIKRFFGKKSHQTIMHAVDNIEKWIDSNQLRITL